MSHYKSNYLLFCFLVDFRSYLWQNFLSFLLFFSCLNFDPLVDSCYCICLKTFSIYWLIIYRTGTNAISIVICLRQDKALILTLIFLSSPQVVNNSMIYYKNAREIGNRARAGAFSFAQLCTVWKARRSIHLSMAWFSCGKELSSLLGANAQGTGFYLHLPVVPRSYLGPFSFLTRETSPWILDFMIF